jgi:hypothetical protein
MTRSSRRREPDRDQAPPGNDVMVKLEWNALRLSDRVVMHDPRDVAIWRCDAIAAAVGGSPTARS